MTTRTMAVRVRRAAPLGSLAGPKGLDAPQAHALGVPFAKLGETLDAMQEDVDMRTQEGVQVGSIEYDPEAETLDYRVFPEYKKPSASS